MDMTPQLNRRDFLRYTAGGAAVLSLPLPAMANTKEDYRGPNVIIVRFGGGVRRSETIEADNTYCPYLLHELSKRGTLFTNMNIAQLEGLNTSHGEGTLNILTGKYDLYKDVNEQFLKARFEAQVPTIFEYLRKQFEVPAHQTLIINGEDRTDEEFYSFSNHHLFGVDYRSNVLSLYRFKTFLLRQQIAAGKWQGQERKKWQKELAKLESLDYRNTNRNGQGPAIRAFWENWRKHYGESGFVNPRGDRLLTELSIRAIKQLHPKLMMINYNDPDYVHWGNMSHYTRGIAIIDEGLQRLVATVDADERYRDNTVFVIVPDCGRDSNRFMTVPCQHHFGGKSSHEIWALVIGPGIARSVVVEKEKDQSSIAATVGQAMGFKARHAEGEVLGEAFA
jgi:hypothetical protein